MLKIFFVMVTTLLISVSCYENEQRITEQPSEKPIIQSSIQTIACKSDTSNTYELYLPNNLKANQKYPVIICFDSHGRGKMPVDSLSETAERYKYIVIGSNRIRNNETKTNEILQILFNDVLARYPIDTTRVYLCGFSGGARLALSIALTNKSIAGVISCAAGLPQIDKDITEIGFDLSMISGKDDFNYLEIKALENNLISQNLKFYTQYFDGGHSWANKEQLRNAVLWLEMNAMRSGKIQKNDSLIDFVHKLFQYEIYVNGQNKNLLGVRDAYRYGYYFLDSLYDNSDFKAKAELMDKTEEFLKEITTHKKLADNESSLREKYMMSFQTQQEDWWKNEVRILNEKMKNESNSEQTHLLKRIKNFWSIAAFMNTDNALKNNDLARAENFIKIYRTIDEKNPDVYYFKAVFLLKKNLEKEALDDLEYAVKLGFADYTKLATQNEFAQIKNKVRYNSIIANIHK